MQRYATQLGDRRFGPGQGACVVAIVNIEDPQWLPTKWNTGGSGAYGLPQALPGLKMAGAGRDWATNGRTQLWWMVESYLPPVYGSACNALAHERAHNWY